jgi:hypothetical protein
MKAKNSTNIKGGKEKSKNSRNQGKREIEDKGYMINAI